MQILPFLQGMEDVIVLDEMMQKYPDDRLRAFEQYSKKRNPDAEAMCDLAMYNYIEVGLGAFICDVCTRQGLRGML